MIIFEKSETKLNIYHLFNHYTKYLIERISKNGKHSQFDPINFSTDYDRIHFDPRSYERYNYLYNYLFVPWTKFVIVFVFNVSNEGLTEN